MHMSVSDYIVNNVGSMLYLYHKCDNQLYMCMLHAHIEKASYAL